MYSLYKLVVINKQKAILGFVIAFSAPYLAKVGFTLDTTLKEVLESLVYGTIGYAGIYLKANK